MSAIGVRRVKAAFLSGCKSHPAILLQPEAIGAVMEAKVHILPKRHKPIFAFRQTNCSYA
jgi:hypothetical protein